jgi:hypothetical protein
MDELGDLGDLLSEIRTNIEALYDLICDAKDSGHTYDELQKATGLARGTLQNIVKGRSPKL